MLPGNLPTGTVANWLDRITIGGEPVDAVTWTVSRQMNHVPGDMSGGDSSRSVDAQIIPVTDPDVIEQATSPWTQLDSWPPAKGTPVTIEVSGDNGGTWVPVVTGITNTASGTTFGDLTVDVIEKVARFSRLMRVEPLQAIMPPWVQSADWRYIGMSQGWWVDKAFRDAGFHIGIPPMPGTTVFASLFGSMWPDTGNVVAANVADKSNRWASYSSVEYGLSFINFDATYLGNTVLTNFDLRVMVPTTQDGTTGKVTYQLQSGTSTAAAVIVDPVGRYAQLQIGGTVRATCAALGEVLVVRRVSGVWQMCTNDGTPVVYTQSSGVTSVDRVTVASTGSARVGEMNLADATGRPALPPSTWNPSATFDSASQIAPMDASPVVWNESTSDILDELATALWSHWGFNEAGQAWWYSTLGRLGLAPIHNEPPIVRTLSDDVDVLDKIEWSTDWQQSACQVVANILAPQVQRVFRPRLNLHTDSSSDAIVAADGSKVDIVNPPDGEDWIMVDLKTTVTTPGTADAALAAQRLDTQLIGSIDLPDTGSGPEDRPAGSSEYAARVDRIDPTAYKVTRQAIGTVAVSAQTGSGANWNWLPRGLWSGSGTIIRGCGKTVWVKGTVSSADNGSDAPVFSFDAGEWIGDNGDLIVSWLTALMTGERVNLSNLEIVPDPRLQLGDRVTLDVTTLGVELTAYVTSKTIARDDDGALTMQVTLVITESTNTAKSWRALEAKYKGGTWTGFEFATTGEDYNQLEANPIG